MRKVSDFKFRFWDKEDKTWAPHSQFEIDEEGIFDLYSDNDRYICQQYTGLKDKNGNEIYEGDIVRVWRLYSDSYGPRIDGWYHEIEVGYIFWADVFLSWQVDYQHIRYDDTEDVSNTPHRYEVLGNILQNKELLDESNRNNY